MNRNDILKVVKILPSTTGANHLSGDILYLKGINLPSEADGDIYLQSHSYSTVFGESKKKSSNKRKQLSIVKVSANGRSIHRAYKSTSANGFTGDCAALTTKSLDFLTDIDGQEPRNVKLSKGSYIPYYWYHPDKSVRLSFKLGLLSILLGTISLIISIVSVIRC